MPHTGHFTAADLATMPDDGQRYEVIDGELIVTPGPGGRHQLLVTRLLGTLWPYLAANHLGDQLLTAPTDITFAADTLVEPDLLVADTAAYIRSGDLADITEMSLFIEIVSPSSARTDRNVKRRAYQRHRVPAYWIVDAEERQIEIWTPDAVSPIVRRDTIEWRHPALAGSVTVDVGALFSFE